MPLSTDKVFMDTGAFIALAARTDRHHQEAVAIYQGLVNDGVRIFTSNHIVDETCTWLLRNPSLGHKAALTFGRFMLDLSVSVTVPEASSISMEEKRVVLVYSSPEIERLAWDLLAKYDNAGFTFTDCTSFALMSRLSINRAFAFDHHFDLLGFVRM